LDKGKYKKLDDQYEMHDQLVVWWATSRSTAVRWSYRAGGQPFVPLAAAFIANPLFLE
jgi:hypothetical protein